MRKHVPFLIQAAYPFLAAIITMTLIGLLLLSFGN